MINSDSLIKYFGIFVICVSIFFLFYCKFDINRNVSCKIIDKYKGQTDYEDANGIREYTDMLYFVVKYNNNAIERMDVHPETYYAYNIGDIYTYSITVGTTSEGNWSMLGLLAGFILFIVGKVFEEMYY